MTEPGIKLIECPRDAMQGWKHIIPTDKKIEYINSLLRVGFDTIDAGSFVSAKAIPQMADTGKVLKGLDMSATNSRLLVIVANERGAEEAMQYAQVSYLGFPFSVSETFQRRNTNSSIAESLKRVEAIQKLCLQHGKQLVIYISMGFGNPYGDPYSAEIVFEWVYKMAELGIKIISLADTVGLAEPEQVYAITDHLVRKMPGHEIGVHLHSTSYNWKAKIDAAMEAGCRRFDGALKGIGGCPMAEDELVGNMDTELLIPYFESAGLLTHLNHTALLESSALANSIFIPGL
ncbi:MAG TPA: hydroxymethylglutaryl-CoA lyase [Chitinophagaceae bacterium]|jgi:hydroxymethylglutaryl-CoA lyase